MVIGKPSRTALAAAMHRAAHQVVERGMRGCGSAVYPAAYAVLKSRLAVKLFAGGFVCAAREP